MKTLNELKAEVRAHTQAELFDLLRRCERRGHVWLDLEKDPVAPGGRPHYCKRCLRVRIIAGAEYWPLEPER